MSVEDPNCLGFDTISTDDAEEQSKSALADNLKTKGKNAYYYAHAHKATGPKWDGKIEPKLLGTSSSNLSTSSTKGVGSSATSSSRAALMAKSNITNYAFLNEATKVKLYINLAGVGNCADENISLDYTEQSLCLTIKNYVAPSTSAKVKVVDEDLVADTAPTPEETADELEERGEDRCLSFGKLYGEIEKATFRKKADKVIVTLKKKDERVWNSVIA